MSVSTLYVVYRAARDFDLGGGFQHSGNYPWCFYIVGREILTLGEGFNTQVITLWCFYIVIVVYRGVLVVWVTYSDVGFPILFGGGFLSDTLYPDVF
jgi:hypothetical protein